MLGRNGTTSLLTFRQGDVVYFGGAVTTDCGIREVALVAFNFAGGIRGVAAASDVDFKFGPASNSGSLCFISHSREVHESYLEVVYSV